MLETAWSMAGAAGIGLVALYGFMGPRSQLFGRVYVRGNTHGEKLLALTFDDGPNEPHTSQILDILAQHQVPATFFVIGKNVLHYPATARRIVADGHTIANHSYSHPPLGCLSGQTARELAMTEWVIEDVTGVRPSLARMPYGRKSPWTLRYARGRGLSVVAWDLAANDPNVHDGEKVARTIVKNAHPGGVILLHDGCGTEHGADRSHTVKAVATLVPQLKAQGYTFVQLATLLGVAPAFSESPASASPVADMPGHVR